MALSWGQWVKDLAFSLQWLGCYYVVGSIPDLGTSTVHGNDKKKKKKKKKKKIQGERFTPSLLVF